MKIFLIKVLIFIVNLVQIPFVLIASLLDDLLWILHEQIPVVTRWRKEK